MIELELAQIAHDKKVGDKVADLTPNVTEDTLFMQDGEVIGFYISDIGRYSPLASKLATIADTELRSKRVPKSEMSRGPQGNKKQKAERAKAGINLVTQYSVILGGVPPKPHMRRNYPTVSSVHSVPSAKNFVKSMILLAKESEKIVQKIMPEQYDRQKKAIAENAPRKYRFGDLFTSSISNCNIAADYHIDGGNLKPCSNVIICKRKDSIGGNTTIPSYGATVDSADNSMLFYPAWRDLHGVTPIHTLAEGGYRNTLVFYPLASFKKWVDEDEKR